MRTRRPPLPVFLVLLAAGLACAAPSRDTASPAVDSTAGLPAPGSTARLPSPDATTGLPTPDPTPTPPAPAPGTGSPPASAGAGAIPGTPRPTGGDRTAAGPGATTSVLVPGSVNRTSLAVSATYDVRASLSYGAGTISAISEMAVTNRSGGPIDRLELNTVAARLGELRLRSVSVEGRRAAPRISDQTINVPLGGVLRDGATARVRIAFGATFRRNLARSNWLFTRYNTTINAYRWLPWISRATPFERPHHGDPFVTQTSPSVRVAITTDRRMGIATSGRRVAVSGLTQTFAATNVRDFNFTASPRYLTRSGSVGRTAVTVFYRNGAQASAMLEQARRALARLSSLLGPYPHPTYTVAESAGGYAMESPAHIWIPPVATSRLPFLITHETAHQWFYGLVGNDQAREPFADEAMVDFLTRYLLRAFRSSACSSNRLDLSIYAYPARCYFELVYVKGGNVLNMVRARMGDGAFRSAIREYVRTYANRVAGTATLLRFLDDRTPVDLRPLYRIYFPSLYR